MKKNNECNFAQGRIVKSTGLTNGKEGEEYIVPIFEPVKITPKGIKTNFKISAILKTMFPNALK